MKERADSLGGTFDIYCENGHGTVIKLVFPI
jgi:signal transduction histidine kinase